MCAHVCAVITHRTIADIFQIGGSNCSLYIGVMQEAKRQHNMEGKQATPRRRKKN